MGLFRLLFGYPSPGPRYRQYRLQRRAPSHLRDVMNAPFEAVRLMNQGEYKVFRLARDNFPDCLAFAQVSLGEILTSPDERAYAAINQKRIDILLVARNGHPLVAVEYQGPGHYQKRAPERDAVKKEALRKAGVGYVEVLEDQADALIIEMIRDALGRVRPLPADPGTAASPR
jgi:hypothetical protein